MKTVDLAEVDLRSMKAQELVEREAVAVELRPSQQASALSAIIRSARAVLTRGREI